MEETRTVLLEGPGIGACSGSEFLWETERKNSEKLKPSPIGTENQCFDSDMDHHNEDTYTSGNILLTCLTLPLA